MIKIDDVVVKRVNDVGEVDEKGSYITFTMYEYNYDPTEPPQHLTFKLSEDLASLLVESLKLHRVGGLND